MNFIFFPVLKWKLLFPLANSNPGKRSGSIDRKFSFTEQEHASKLCDKGSKEIEVFARGRFRFVRKSYPRKKNDNLWKFSVWHPM